MGFLAAFLRFVLVLLVVRFVGRLIAQALRRNTQPAAKPAAPPPPSVAEPLVRDRVCNTFVPRSRALRAVVGGQEEWFCSPACRDKAGARAS